MKITTITDIGDFNCDNDTVIGLQYNKIGSSNDLRFLKITTEDMFVKMDSHVKLYSISPNNIKIWPIHFEGKLRDGLKEIGERFNIFSFPNFDEFYQWYINKKN